MNENSLCVVTLQKMLGITGQLASTSGDHECHYIILWQSIHLSLRYLILDQSGGRTERQANIDPLSHTANVANSKPPLAISTTVESELTHSMFVIQSRSSCWSKLYRFNGKASMPLVVYRRWKLNIDVWY